MNPALDWLTGRSVANVEKRDYSWFFTFKQGGLVQTESFWRLITPKRIAVTSEDHGHLFGLKEPMDAVKCVMSAIESKTITHYSCSDICSDLILYFGNEIELHFLNLSCGYESWQAMNDDFKVICMGGGGLSIFNQKRK